MIYGLRGEKAFAGDFVDAVIGDDAPNARQAFGGSDAVGSRNLIRQQARIVGKGLDVVRQFRRQKRLGRDFEQNSKDLNENADLTKRLRQVFLEVILLFFVYSLRNAHA